jgi:hypothetical protein
MKLAILSLPIAKSSTKNHCQKSKKGVYWHHNEKAFTFLSKPNRGHR